MIYISSSCIKKQRIGEAVLELIKNDFYNIELSGGTYYYDGWLDELLELKNKYNVNYLIHNYFPPPKEAFVFNLSSLDAQLAKKSLEHAKNSIEHASLLGSEKIGFHAGFLINIAEKEIGRKIQPQKLYDKEIALKTFVDNYHKILLWAHEKNIKLYIENNVLSLENYKTFKTNPFFFVKSGEINLFQNLLSEFNYIFDYAHSFVSSKTLNINEISEFDNFIAETDYIHLSDNNGTSDNNSSIRPGSSIYNHLMRNPPINKTVTLEIYEDIHQIIKVYNWLNNLKSS